MQLNSREIDKLLETAGSGQPVQTMLDYFAVQVDYQIQTQLVSELMARYVEVSRQLELRNRQLQQSDASRREAQRIAALGNWRLNLATRRLWWSDIMKELLDLDLDCDDSHETELHRFLDAVYSDDLPLIQTTLDALDRGIEPPPVQIRLVTKDGQIKWMHIRCVINREAGKNQLVHGTIQDITATKLIEEKLKKYNDHLEELVAEKVKVITATQLSTIYALVKLAESRDDETGDHIGRTAAYCKFLAEKLLERGEYPDVVNPEFVEAITNASPLHDIGKVGIPDAMSYHAIPAVLYTSPEAAGIGLTEQAAREQGIDIQTASLSLRYSGRFLAEVQGGDGICKVIADGRGERLLGVHLLGRYASELISGVAPLMESGMKIADLKKAVYAHPTVGELLRDTLFALK